MLSKKNRLFTAVRMLIAINCLAACTPANYNICPHYPVAGPGVAAELEKASFEAFPKTWEWIGRIDKLRQELDMCR
ncbi:MAG: hypothetical protein LBU87_03670 [Lactobacillales bacterium]|nr:hypothetical protein [Lactobacillales bacterium]